jgi:hypothetical protein
LLFCRAAVALRAPAGRSRAVVVRGSADKDNIYHDRETTKSRRSNPAGTKDAAIRKHEAQEQFDQTHEYQQER